MTEFIKKIKAEDIGRIVCLERMEGKKRKITCDFFLRKNPDRAQGYRPIDTAKVDDLSIIDVKIGDIINNDGIQTIHFREDTDCKIYEESNKKRILVCKPKNEKRYM